jgi:SHO1 osmosensor
LAIATNQLAIHRFQLAVVIAISIVFAVIGVNDNIYSGVSARYAVGAGWLLIAMVDVSHFRWLSTNLSSSGLSTSPLKRILPSIDS